jgi:hypothetical protein
MTLGATGEDEDTEEHGFGTRSVGAGRRVSTILPPILPSFRFFLTLRSSTRETKCALSAL